MVDALVLYLASCALFIALRDDGGAWAIVAIGAVAGFGIRLTHVIRTELQHQDTPRRVRWVLLALLLLTGAALLWAWAATDRSDGWGFFGVATLYLGVGLVVSQVRHSRIWSRPIGIRVGVVVGVAVVAAVAGLAAGQPWAAAALAIAIVTAPVAISLLSAGFNRALEQDAAAVRARRVAGVGAVLFGAALAGLVLFVDVGASYVLLFGVGMFVLVLAVAARSNADVVLVIAAVALVWATAPKSTPLDEAVTPEPGEQLLVAMGDSFMSGEGAGRFFEGTNTQGVNECRRAPTAYSPLVVTEDRDEIPDDVVFLACSGARATHLYDVPQHPGEPIGRPAPSSPSPEDAEVVQGLPQLENLTWQLETSGLSTGAVDVVLLSIGGNDALFGDIAQACVLPGECSELGQAWLDNLEREVGPVIAAAYEAVDTALPDTRIVVVPYPIPLAPTKQGCGYSMFSRREHAFLFSFTQHLNATLREEAAERDFAFLDEMETALEGRRLCDGGPDDVGVNFLAVNGVDGLIEQESNPRHWFHNSMHPNESGHEAMERVVRDWLVEHADDPARAPLATATAPAPPDGLGRTCTDDPALQDCVAEWSRREQARFLLFPASLVAVLGAGAWLLALALIRIWRRRAVPSLDRRFSPGWERLQQRLRRATRRPAG